VRDESPIQKIADLRGARVSTGSAGSGTEIVAGRVLESVGIDQTADIRRQRMSAAASAAALRDRRIDAFFFTGGLPTPAVASLARQTPIRLLPVEEEMVTLQNRYGDFYLSRSIPASAYTGLTKEVPTLGIANVLVARKDMPEQLAYALTELLFEAKPELASAHAEGRRLDRRAALATFPVPLHPGAARYYRRSKSMV
jgi:TRAP transporter TAXI family solute receptor